MQISGTEFRKILYEICPGFVADDYNKQMLFDLHNYVNGTGNLDPKKGIWMWGNVGTGKSTLIRVLGEVMRLQNRGFKTINCSKLANDYSAFGVEALTESTYNDQCGILKPVNRAFDEIGREPLPAKHYGNELNVMQYIFQIRYEFRDKILTFGTTNMFPDAIIQFYGKYISDRIEEMFNVVELKGNSRRK